MPTEQADRQRRRIDVRVQSLTTRKKRRSDVQQEGGTRAHAQMSESNAHGPVEIEPSIDAQYDTLMPYKNQHVVYLLQSCGASQCTYIGYSNNMPRRIRQHNGIIKGGAKYTSNPSRQPWRVACLVTGFDDGILATRFEWAWKNCHRSKLMNALLETSRGEVKRAVGAQAKMAIAKRATECGKRWFGRSIELVTFDA